MRHKLAIALLLLATTSAFGHAGEVHSYMGVVTAVHDDGSFTMKKADGAEIAVLTANTTTYLHADDQPATRNELGAGMRVVVKMDKDGKTALSVKMRAAKGR